MGVSIDSPKGSNNGGQSSWSSLRFLTRRKQVDSAHNKTEGLLAKELSVPHLIGIGNSLQKLFVLNHFFFKYWIHEFICFSLDLMTSKNWSESTHVKPLISLCEL